MLLRQVAIKRDQRSLTWYYLNLEVYATQRESDSNNDRLLLLSLGILHCALARASAIEDDGHSVEVLRKFRMTVIVWRCLRKLRMTVIVGRRWLRNL